uniref:Uncharacterized protein n=1 Tax=viral metagenome TaxID=1070528 RepID=A0A6H2A2R3_9ZZZZ
MKICSRCKKEYKEVQSGYAIPEMKVLCPDCWRTYLEISHHYHAVMSQFLKAISKDNPVKPTS